MGAVLSPHDRAYPLVCAHLCLVAVDLSVGAAGTTSMGGSSSVRDRFGRESCFQHLAFRRVDHLPLFRTGAFHLFTALERPNVDAASFGWILHHAGSVARPGGCRRVSGGRSPDAP